MQTTRTATAPSPEATRLRPREPMSTADLDDIRRFDYTEGWDEDDAALGWVDVDTVRRPRRLH